MIYVTGDTHGEYGRLIEFNKTLKSGDYIIVCGDWGYIFLNNESENKLLDDVAEKPWTMLFVDGNHENHPAINLYPQEIWNGGKIHRIRKNIIHLCRGQVFEVENKKFFTFGGAYSIDKALRIEGYSWWKDEMPTDADFVEANKNLDAHNREVDYIITHTAPEETMNIFHPDHIHEKPLNNFLEYVRESVKYKHWYMGHLHRDEDVCVNVKMKMYKNADSKCTILAKYSQIGYNLSGSDENELQKRHLREGEIYA